MRTSFCDIKLEEQGWPGLYYAVSPLRGSLATTASSIAAPL